MAKKPWGNPHTKHVPSPDNYALSKPGKNARSTRRRKEAAWNQKRGQR